MTKRISLLLIFIMTFGLFQSVAQAQGPVPATASDTLAVVLVVDTSGSMAGERLTTVKRALRSFIPAELPVSAALIAFDETAEVVQPFTRNERTLAAAVDNLRVGDRGASSALYEAAASAAELVTTVEAGRRVVILVTDSAHTSQRSPVTRSAALQAVEASGAQVFSLTLGTTADRAFLDELATRSGGELVALADTASFEPALTRIQTAFAPIPATPGELTLAGTLIESALPEDEPSALVPVGDGNAALVLALDVSESMSGTPLRRVQETTSTFVETVDGEIPVAVVSFSSRVEVVEDFSTSPDVLTDAIQRLTPGGVTALYDGALEAVQLAVERDTPNRMVILIGDGTEYGGQSAAVRGAALELAQEHAVRVYTIGLGNSVDSAFLEELALGTDGEFYRAAAASELGAIYAELADSILEAHRMQASPTIPPLELSAQLPPLLPQLGDPASQPQPIAPLDAEFQVAEAAEAPVEETAIEPVTPEPAARAMAAVPPAITPEDLMENVYQPFSPIVPVTVEVAEGEAFGPAELYVNGEFVAAAERAPYQFILDTRLLLSGTYELEVVARTATSGFYSDVMTFEVATIDRLPLTGVQGPAPQSESAAPAAPTALRVVLVEGESQPLHLVLSQQTGLTLYQPASVAPDAGETPSLRAILASPIDSLPEPVRRLLTEQHPRAVSIIIIVLAVILLPQGMFTIYWMTYSWVNEHRMQRSGAPETYYDPLYSFTALIPARREEMVLYDTIMAVHHIDYPDELKEILVLIRDDDDDATIAAANRAIADIQAAARAEGRAEDNVRLITFKDGPKNKPNGLNRGYREANNDVICIFDAEDQPHAEVYQVINTVMQRDGADVVQSGVQLMNFRSNWFSAFNVLEYFFWFKSGLHAFTHGLRVTPLGGNTVFFKREWLDKLAAQDTEHGYRAWDEYCLTEDADIGIRLTAMGARIQIVYEARQATQEETPANVDQFIKQRTRWSQGFYEIFFKFDWLRLPTLKQRVGAVYILLNSLLQGGIIFFLPFGLFIWATQIVPVGIAILSWMPICLLFIQLTVTLIGIREFTEAYGLKLPLLFRLRMAIYYYPYQLLLSIAAVRAMIRFITNQSSWEKTEHANLHRTPASAGSSLRA
ncbi:MAG: VWA domain-containing protein [Anaerolineae bacterium]|nr:VWA domain-containing protein [Anaerolineae bacterium]